MPYLAPPPEPAPVVVVRDIGGNFSRYSRQTSAYRVSNREVQLHECHSACTLALSLPRVCVLPSSILRFNQIYDHRTKKVDVAASDVLFRSYPSAVRARLGYLTRQYKSLSGAELIALGIRNCETGKSLPMMVAEDAAAVRQPAYVPPGQGPVARFLSRTKSRVAAMLPGEIPGKITAVPGNITKHISRSVSQVFSGRWFAAKVDRTAVGAIPSGHESRQPDSRVVSPAITPGLVDAETREPQVLAGAKLAKVPRRRQQVRIAARPAAKSLTAAAGRRAKSGGAKLPAIITGAYPVLPPKFRAYAPLR